MRESIVRRLLDQYIRAIRNGDQREAWAVSKAILEEMNRQEWNNCSRPEPDLGNGPAGRKPGI